MYLILFGSFRFCAVSGYVIIKKLVDRVFFGGQLSGKPVGIRNGRPIMVP